MGIYPLIANTITWVANNTEGVYKRGVVLGFVIGWGNLNGVMAANVYRAEDAPQYRFGHAMVLAYLTIGLFGGSMMNWFYLRNQNTKRKRGDMDDLLEGKLQGKMEKEIVDELGDQR
jgi:DMSO reductase anchor subunit